jgi:hypothetical protein
MRVIISAGHAGGYVAEHYGDGQEYMPAHLTQEFCCLSDAVKASEVAGVTKWTPLGELAEDVSPDILLIGTAS